MINCCCRNLGTSEMSQSWPPLSQNDRTHSRCCCFTISQTQITEPMKEERKKKSSDHSNRVKEEREKKMEEHRGDRTQDKEKKKGRIGETEPRRRKEKKKEEQGRLNPGEERKKKRANNRGDRTQKKKGKKIKGKCAIGTVCGSLMCV